MRIISRKWWLTWIALLLLVPAASASMSPLRSNQRRQNMSERRHTHTVPESGCALAYVVGAGLTCLGAMVVRSRSARPKQA